MSRQDSPTDKGIAGRFRGFLPVVVDIETGGFDANRHAILEMAAVIVEMNADGTLQLGSTHRVQVAPYAGSIVEPEALKITGIDPDHPERNAVDEKEAMRHICNPIRQELRRTGCSRAVMVAHNPAFDMGFFNTCVNRCGFKRNPFHPFTTFDTATLGGLVYGQTVLSRAVEAAGLEWESDQAHSAAYDAEQTARLFCGIVNRCASIARVV